MRKEKKSSLVPLAVPIPEQLAKHTDQTHIEATQTQLVQTSKQAHIVGEVACHKCRPSIPPMLQFFPKHVQRSHVCKRPLLTGTHPQPKHRSEAITRWLGPAEWYCIAAALLGGDLPFPKQALREHCHSSLNHHMQNLLWKTRCCF